MNYLVGNFNPITGEISLLNTADPGSQVQVSFYFRVANSYTANDHRVRVHSASDPDGEWVAISEVTSESDATASPTSDLFKGEVPLSGNNAASGSGDGAVWVQSGGMLTVTYYEADVVTVIASHQASIVSVPAPSPTPNASPTPIPSVGPVALGVLAGALALFLWQRTRGRPTSA